MSQYKGKTVTIDRPIDEVFAKVSNLGDYQKHVDLLPADVRAAIGDIRFEPDAIIITAQPVGDIRLQVTDRKAPTHMTLQAENSPVPLNVNLDLTATGEAQTRLVPSVDVDVPMMLRPFVAPKMQEAADKLGEMLGNLFGGH